MRLRELLSSSDAQIDEGWKEKAAAGILSIAGAAGFNALNKDSPPQEAPQSRIATGKIEIEQPKKSVAAPVTRNYNERISKKVAFPFIVKAAKAAGLSGAELVQFIAQSSHETIDFFTLSELGNNEYFNKYDPVYNPIKAKELGNTKPGDGARYKGRGFLQITGRYNYRIAGKALGLPLEEHPELLTRPDIAAKASLWYWKTRVQPKVSNFRNTQAVTYTINPGLAGLSDRKNKFSHYSKVMTQSDDL